MKEKETSHSPWGEERKGGDRSLSFEDSFVIDGSEPDTQQDKTYVPLDDSEQYLAGLEKKLARLQGKASSLRESERRRLMTGLAQSRQNHAANFLNSSNPLPSDKEDIDPDTHNPNKSLNAVDPQGTLGLVMRKCVPNHVALSAEELCELLQADILSKVRDELHSEAEGTEKDTIEEEPKSKDEKELQS